MSGSPNEIDIVRNKLQKEKKYRMEVEEERDFLLADNTRLRAELERLIKNGAVQNVNPSDLVSKSVSTAKSVLTVEARSKSYAHILGTKINDACGGKNAVCTSFMPYKNVHCVGSTDEQLYNESDSDIWLCGGVDAQLSGYDSESKAQLFSIKLSAPVLSIDVHGASIACGMIDGSHTIVSYGAFDTYIVRLSSCLHAIVCV